MYLQCLRTCEETFKLLTSCGFLPNLKKSKLVPSQSVVVLGTVVDSVSMTVYLPKDKEEGILQLIEDCLQTHHMTIRELAKLIGKLVSCTVVCPLGKLYYRDLERLKTRSLCLNGNRWDSSCRLNSKCRSELSWWLDNLPNSKTPIVCPNPHYTITFDASSYTWGAVLNGVTAQGHFSPSELPLSINMKET